MSVSEISTSVHNANSLNGMPRILNCANNNGVLYKDFRKTLSIKPKIIIFNMILAWTMIISSIAIFSAIESIVFSIILILPLSLWLSFWMQSYTSHFHEAAHFNIHPDKTLNDLFSDIFLTPFIGLRVKDYRVSHWMHHRFLGLPADTEVSYHKPIGFIQVIEGITGIYLLRTALRYFKNFKDIDSQHASEDKKSSAFVKTLVLMVAFNLAVSFCLYIFLSTSVALAWLCSVFITGPFLAHLRQTLEHRSFGAQRMMDYTRTEHGPCNRIFGTDFFSKNFGGSGFNRHLLHHLDPSISYTCFDELELFLLDTTVRDFIQDNRSTYLKTFLTLVKQ